ncbi:MAG: stress responsive protein [Clostridiales bacterium]|jgi:hypothetical protein|nr:stress responsive protein [Clostridiales bacterium]
MIKHIVCFKLKDNSTENCEKTKEVLMSMKDKVDLIRDIQVGIDFLKSERSYDVILEVILDSRDALDLYQDHPYHVDVVKAYIQTVRSESIAVDYEIEKI